MSKLLRNYSILVLIAYAQVTRYFKYIRYLERFTIRITKNLMQFFLIKMYNCGNVEKSDFLRLKLKC